MPDINTLPPSRSTTGSPSQSRVQQDLLDSPARSSSGSLATAAVTNASLQDHGSLRSPHGHRAGAAPQRASRHERQRSSAASNLTLNDPALPLAGEVPGSERRLSASQFRTTSPQGVSPLLATADPHHRRTPSLGELHQQLEQEQEAQVASCMLLTLGPRS